MSDNVTIMSDTDFEAEVLQSPLPVLVDFWAAWCVPCRMIAPIVAEIAVEMDGRVKVCKMDVDSNQKTPAKYGIRGIPTLLLFKGGELQETIVGVLPKDKIVAAVTKLL